ncbi:Cof-type HAD-IIB family hydrolase [Ferviditalea candida]|uniref:Cof-type HAD-IIB family hydrolase n=1 Tax=Ferviditalea candida TaxID=3108399 RepID=A0ABU5ZJ14_9BACL|nr:Cof-type HAD-IIB family hydrolase [Paenibacillaceae bacterium T2]
MYKMLMIDIDDTLLNDERQIPDETKESLRLAANKGVIVTLATGRMFASAKQVAAKLNLNVPIITYQGALVKNSLDDKVLYERSVPGSIVRKLIEYAESRSLHLQLYYNDELLVKDDNEKAREYSRISNVPYRVLSDFSGLSDQPMLKLLFIEQPEELDQIQPELEEIFGKQVNITKSKPHFLEITNAEATKGQALKLLARHYGFEPENVIAIGDSWNDQDMIAAAGVGVAMGNAVPALKQIADYITLTHNEQGVKHVIEKFIL